METSETHHAVRQKYGAIARVGGESCCEPGACGCGDPISSDLYSRSELDAVPPEAAAISLGCGNPTALAELSSGDIVLDLGSGGGIDVFLAARRGSTGKVFGLDMTDEMLTLARSNQQRAGVTNVEFLKGTIEAIPLPDQSVTVILSNCVVNLSPDKGAVFREAFRVLKPGGRLAISDVIVRGEVPADIRRSMELWVGCVAGALEESEYRNGLASAGFESIQIEPWRVYDVNDARQFLAGAGVDVEALASVADNAFASASIQARKPLARTCCGPACCAA
jgi:SAM-dependent methyltransferase